MYNSGRRGKRAPDGYGIISVNEQFNQTEYPIPIITSYAVTDGSYVATDDLALSTTGGQTVVIYGSGFKSGIVVNINGTNRTTTLLDSGRLAITSPALSSGSYTIYASNTDGATAIYVPGLIYSGTPTWSTGTDLGSGYETKSYSQSLSATSDSTVSYSLAAGSTLPSGVNLTSGGSLSGTLPVETGSTTYAFTVVATDAELQETTRQFSLTVNTDVVTWSTPSADYVISSYEYSAIANVTASATSAAGYGVVYSANTLPTGITLDENGGLISGTINTVGNTNTRLTATANTSTRSASRDVVFNVNQDVVTWSSPADATAYTLTGGSAMANVTMAATSAAGRSIIYSANALPSGVYIDGATLYGTPDTAQTVFTLLTAQAATTNRTATRTISWTISLGDIYWKNTTLLLNAVTPTTTFINDASLNNNQLTIAGDTKPNNFNPYTEGYYSNYFDGGSGSYLTVPSGTPFNMGTSDFSIEMWVNPIAQSAYGCLLTLDNGDYPIAIYWGSSTSGGANIIAAAGTTTAWFTNTTAMTFGTTTKNKWSHILMTRSGNNWRCFQDGVLRYYASQAGTVGDSSGNITIGSNGNSSYATNAYISNVRIIKGSIPTDYQTSSTTTGTSIFTPSTSPLTTTSQGAVASNVSLLTCQDNRFIDKSYNNHTVTKNGVSSITSSHPFAAPTTAAYNTQYSTYFDGTGDSLSITANLTPLVLGTNDFTIEFWVYANALAAESELLDFRPTGTNGLYPLVYVSSSGTFGWWINSADRITGGTLAVKTWTHVAVCRSSGSTKMYVNGTQIGSTYTDTNNYLCGKLTVGMSANSLYPLNGHLSNLRVIKGTALYTSSFTPSTTTLTAVSGTSLLTCQSSTLIDNSTNNLTITSNGDARPIAVSPFTQTTSTNSVTNLGSAYFDGTGDALTTVTSPAYSFGSGNFTVEGWINPAAVNIDSQAIVLRRSSGYATGDWEIVLTNTSLVVFAYDKNSSTSCITGNIPVVANTWTHFALVRDGSILTLYQNGVPAGSVAFAVTIGENSQGITIGRDNVGPRWHFTGYISDIRILKGTALYTANFLPPQTLLTPVTNTQLLTCQYNGGATNNGFVDQSSFNNIVTRVGNTTQGTFSPYSQNGWSAYYSGVADNNATYVAANAAFSFGTGDFTVEAWLNTPTLSNTNGKAIIDSRPNSTNGGYWLFGLDNVGKVYFMTKTSGGTTVTAPSVLPVNQWNHVAVTRRSGTINLWINGSSVASASTNTDDISSDIIKLGRNAFSSAASDTWFAGYMSNVRIVKGKAVYTGTFTPPTVSLSTVQPAGTNIVALTGGETSLLTHQSNQFIDNSAANRTITTLNTWPPIVAYSPFGGTSSVPTSYSNYFDGTGDYITTPASTNNLIYYPAGTDFTFECWVYPTAAVANQDIFGSYSGGTAGRWILYTNSDGLTPIWYQYPSLNGSFTAGSGSMTLNAWNHIAIVRIGGTTKGYLNGVERLSSTATYDLDGGTASMYVGTGYTGRAMFNGHISNLRMVRGVGVYTGAFTPPTSPLTKTQSAGTNISAITGSQTVLLTCQSPTIVDNSNNNYTLTANGDVKTRAYNPFGTTSTTGTPSVNGGSMYFDGTGDYLTIPNTAGNLSLGAGDFTWECWIYYTGPAAGATYGYQIAGPNTGQGSTGWGVVFNRNIDTKGFGIVVANAWAAYATNFVPVNTWTHLAITRTGSGTNNLKMFMNGVQVTQATYTTADTYTATPVYIGSDAYAANPGSFTQGYLSDMRFIKGTSLYPSNFVPPVAPVNPNIVGVNSATSTLLLTGTSGGIVDAHGTTSLETVGNTQLASEDPYSGNYYSTQLSSSGYLTAPANTAFDLVGSGGSFTIEAWVYFNSYNAAPSSGSYIAGTYQSSSGWLWGFNGVGTVSQLQYVAYSSGSGTQANITVDTTLIPLGKWIHVATVNNSGTLTTYINGVATGGTQSAPSYTGSGGQLAIGVYQQNLGYAGTPNWYISNLRVTKGVAVYTGNFTVPTGPLSATQSSGTNISAITGTSTSILTCQSNKFKDNSTNAFTLTRNTAGSIKSMNPFRNNSGKSLYFDGTGDYLWVPTNPSLAFGTSDFTVEMWVYQTSLAAATLCDFRGAVNNIAPSFELDSSGRIFIYRETSGTLVTSTSAIKAGSWNHVAFTRSGSTVRLFINGILDVTTATDTSNWLIPTTKMTVASNYTAGGYLNGYIKDLRITKSVARYTTTFTPPTTTFEVK